MNYAAKFYNLDGSQQSKEYQSRATSIAEFRENFEDMLGALRTHWGQTGRYRVTYFIPGQKKDAPLPLQLRNFIKALPAEGLGWERIRGGVQLTAVPEQEQPLDLYKQSSYTIPDKYPMDADVAAYAAEQRAAYETFVGTRAEVEAEGKAVEGRIKQALLDLRAAYNAKLDAQVKKFWDQAFAEQGDLHPEILGFIHGRAYERGHSSGHGEVYHYFREYCDEYRELKQLEKKLGL